ncbi:vWA domain-containing protein [Nitrococcus mobilis]|uniref:VWFA domain-containing protein n=1 Tax=Nitrococcus mobilis Nb-231 TaxID=314278 RepID=A4BV97_9GAMM|nr:vWA domain-containing protein [Nitrococcus mobilis]EAR20364.1 hypothetical protein NB231_06815 [Nitrococcus mobilis Nb-231]
MPSKQEAAEQSMKYAVDLVFCIDKTSSMVPLIRRVKENALKFHEDLSARMEEMNKRIDELRIRVVAFGDIYADGDDWLEESDFFNLPDQIDEYKNFVTDINAKGGGDDPENGLEGLALSLQSDWTKGGDRRRHVIVVWTDTSAHKLERAIDEQPENYPKGMPKSFDELTDQWDSPEIDASARRLILFAPDEYPWSDIAAHWEEVVHFTSKGGDGLGEMDYSFIMNMLAHSI